MKRRQSSLKLSPDMVIAFFFLCVEVHVWVRCYQTKLTLVIFEVMDAFDGKIFHCSEHFYVSCITFHKTFCVEWTRKNSWQKIIWRKINFRAVIQFSIAESFVNTLGEGGMKNDNNSNYYFHWLTLWKLTIAIERQCTVYNRYSISYDRFLFVYEFCFWHIKDTNKSKFNFSSFSILFAPFFLIRWVSFSANANCFCCVYCVPLLVFHVYTVVTSCVQQIKKSTARCRQMRHPIESGVFQWTNVHRCYVKK